MATGNKKICHDKGSNQGFTIVELLVAAIIMLIAVFAIVVVVRKSAEIEETDHHARQARTVIMKIFEDDFDYRSYPGLYGPYAFQGTAFDTAYKVPIDVRKFRAEPLMGDLSISVRSETIRIDGALDVPVDTVRIKIVWAEVDGVKDSVSLTKVLAGTE